MNTSSDDFVSIVQQLWFVGSNSTTFFFLKCFLGLYIFVLFVDIVLLFILRPIGSDLKKGLWGTKERPLASPRKLRREWKRIEARLSSGVSSEYKLAILEADAFVGRVLSEIGYAGNSTGEILENLRSDHFVSFSALREAHEVHNRVVFDHDYILDRTEATRVMALFFEFLDEAEIFSD